MSKCFQIEQPKETPIIFTYEILDEGHSIDFSLYYGLAEDPNVQILKETLKKKVGHINYNTDNSGYFTYCLKQSSQLDTPTVEYYSISILN